MAKSRKGLDLVRESFFLSAAERATQRIYEWAKNGLVGGLLTAYPKTASEGKEFHPPAGLRRFLWKQLEECGARRLLTAFASFLRDLRSRVLGTLILSYGIYALIIAVLQTVQSREGETYSTFTVPILSAAAAIVCIGASIPLVMSRRTLREDIAGSSLASLAQQAFGIDLTSSPLPAGRPRGHSNLAFILGMILGLATYFVPAVAFPLAIAGAAGAWMLIVSPETGVCLLFFLMPFLPTMVLVALTAFIALSFFIKLLLGKRTLSLEAVDLSVIAFGCSLAFGGVLSFSRGSIKPALVFVCFLCAFFLVAFFMRSRDWLMRCVWAALCGAVLVSLFGVYQYFFGMAWGGAWIDASLFSDISGRVTSTLENPNMLAEYLILLFPMAFARLVTASGRSERRFALGACLLLGACLILTWSRGAWLGILFSMIFLLLIWHRRTLYLLLAGVLSIPILPLVLPSSIVSRFTSIGNLADTSTSYRVNIWRGAVHMLRDYWISGIGIGESAWGTVYPRYSLAAIESAPHSHNLFLQIWVEMGVAGLIVFLVFLVLLLQSHFQYYRSLSELHAELTGELARSVRSLEDTEPPERKADRAVTAARLCAAAPLCGLIASLMQGLTDYTWYNYRVYLLFWLVAGLSSAFVRCGREENERRMAHYDQEEVSIPCRRNENGASTSSTR